MSLWEEDGRTPLSEREELQENLDENAQVFVDNVSFHAAFDTALVKFKVVNRAAKERIKQKGANAEIANALLSEIKNVGQYRGLLFALSESNQEFILHNMGFNEAEIKKRIQMAKQAPQVNPPPATGAPAAPAAAPAPAQAQAPAPAPTNGFSEAELAEKIMKALKRKRVSINKNSHYDRNFSDHLVAYDVIQDPKRKKIMEVHEDERMGELLDHLPTRPKRNQLMFVRALIDTNQSHVVEFLSLSEKEIDYIRSCEAE